MGDYRILVEVSPLGKAADVWGQSFVIKIRQEQGSVVKIKNCKNVDELRWYLNG